MDVRVLMAGLAAGLLVPLSAAAENYKLNKVPIGAGGIADLEITNNASPVIGSKPNLSATPDGGSKDIYPGQTVQVGFAFSQSSDNPGPLPVLTRDIRK
jgi:hypothetical protein